MTEALGRVAVKIVIVVMLSAIITSMYSCAFMREKRIDRTANHATVQVASDGGPMPTCGTGNLPPCGPKDDGLIRKIISILIG